MIARRAGRPIVVTVVGARDRNKDRGVDLSPYAWEDDMVIMGEREDVDVVVELVGGSDGPALSCARTTIEAGKALVTANKAMIAHHGLELAAKAEAAKVALKFEAAVAGGIPVIKALREGAAANAIERVYGILNGTCNYILSTMEDTGRGFGEVLSEAQAKGYAEADPAFDVEGTDAAHKLSILAAIAFGSKLDFAAVETSGITRLTAADIAQADALDGAKALDLLRASRRAKLGSWEIGGDYLYFVIKLPDTVSAKQLEAAMDVAAEVADNKELDLTGERDEF